MAILSLSPEELPESDEVPSEPEESASEVLLSFVAAPEVSSLLPEPVSMSIRSAAPSTSSTAAAMMTVLVVFESFAIYLCLLRTQITIPSTMTRIGITIQRIIARTFALPWFISKPTVSKVLEVMVTPSVLPEI